MDANRLKGLAVVTLAEADRVGRVDDLVFETSPLTARALRLSTEVGPRLVGLDRIRSIGADAIVVDDNGAVDASDRSLRRHEFPTLNDLEKLKVVDDHGTYLGHIASLEVDPMNGAVSRVDVNQGGVLGVGSQTTTLTVDQIVSVGPELITVRQAA